MPTAPTLVAAYAANALTASATNQTSSSLSLQAGDIVVVLGVDEGVGTESITACSTTFANGGITQLQAHAAASNTAAAAWTFTVSTTGSGTVSIQQNSGNTTAMTLSVYAFRGGVAPVVARSAQQASATRTLSYTPSQADSAIVWVVGDWAAAATQSTAPTSTSHNATTPGPTAVPFSAQAAPRYTSYSEVLDDQTGTGTVAYGIGGTGTGPFTIIVVEVQGSGGAAPATPPILTMQTRRAY